MTHDGMPLCLPSRRPTTRRPRADRRAPLRRRGPGGRRDRRRAATGSSPSAARTRSGSRVGRHAEVRHLPGRLVAARLPGRPRASAAGRPEPADRRPGRAARHRGVPRRRRAPTRRRTGRRSGSSAAAGRWSTSPAARRPRSCSTPSCRTGRSSCSTATSTAPGPTRLRSNGPASTATPPTRPTGGSSGTPRPASRPARCTRARPTGSTSTSCPRRPRTTGAAAILAAQAHLHALGITGWQDAWVTPDTQRGVRAACGRRRLDRPGGRVAVVGPGHEAWSRSPTWSSDAARPLTRRWPASVSIRQDQDHARRRAGELHRRDARAVLRRTRRPRARNHGLTYLEPADLLAAVVELDRLGFQVHQHAIGDRAVRLALDAVEAAREGQRQQRQPPPHRPHPGGPAERMLRFAALDVIANAQAYWAQSEPQMDS